MFVLPLEKESLVWLMDSLLKTRDDSPFHHIYSEDMLLQHLWRPPRLPKPTASTYQDRRNATFQFRLFDILREPGEESRTECKAYHDL